MDSLVTVRSPAPPFSADILLRCRSPAPPGWLAAQLRPGLRRRNALVAICRAELDWARTDWRAVAAALRLAADPEDEEQEIRLPHEAAAARLLNAWGHLHPSEHRIHAIMARLKLQRIAAADRADWAHRAQGSLDDLRWYRRERRRQWAAFLAAAAFYHDARRNLS